MFFWTITIEWHILGHLRYHICDKILQSIRFPTILCLPRYIYSETKVAPSFLLNKRANLGEIETFMSWKFQRRCCNWIVIWYKFNKGCYCRRIFGRGLLCFEGKNVRVRTQQLDNNAVALVYCNPFQVFWQNMP